MAAFRAPLSRLGVSAALGRARPGPPDFVGVGTAGGGTLWWLYHLERHPDVESRPKSQRPLDFFHSFCHREMTRADVEDYHAQFPRRPGRITGEWSQRYMGDFWTPPLLRRAAPDAKLLVLLCDPIERYRRKLADELRRRPPEDAAYYMADIAPRARYATQLKNLWELYEPERVLVLQYERCRSDPLGEYARTLRFLGLRDDFEPFSGMRNRAVAAIRRVLVRSDRVVDLWPDLERALRAELEGEMTELKALVPELDFALWPGFAHLAAGPSPPVPERA